MSTLEQFIKMRDGISNPINKATQAVNKLYLAEEQMANSTLKAEQSMENMANGVKNNIAGINKTIPYTIGQLEALGAYQDKLGRWHGADGKYLKVNIDTIQAERNVSSLKESIESLKDSLTGSFIIGSIFGDMIFNAIEEIASIPSKLIKASDAYSGIMARLNLVAGGQEQAIALNEQIYQSALRARGPYDVMADSVSKIAMTAKEAFPDPRTVVPFMENIQKLFNIGGTDIERQKDALLQLTQALGSGKLQGDELRSIAEAAPLIEKYIADYMGVSMGEIKQLGADGEITAEIIKNAILGATDEINKQFETIPMKWEDIWTNIQSRISHAFQPVYVEINKLANSSLVKSFANNLVAAATIGANAINGLINNIKWLNSEFDNLTKVVKEENKSLMLQQLIKIYEVFVKITDKCYDSVQEQINTRTKLNIYKAYSKLDANNWNDIYNDTKMAVDEFSKLMTDSSISNNKQYSINKIYVMLSELKKASEKQDTQVFLIKYKNTLEELNNL